jgi:predicted GH43/DUF377 family glycosyl hydrolase
MVWKEPGLQVMTVHNAGINLYQGNYIMLFRSHLRNGISVIGMASSLNGIDQWKISPGPVLKPATKNDSFADGVNINDLITNEGGGVEDPRITKIDDTYYITYSAYHGVDKDRVRVSLATTNGFNSFTRHGPVLNQDMRNVVIFPETINELYYALMRPNDHTDGVHAGGIFREIRLAHTKNLTSSLWHLADEPVMAQSGAPSPFADKIGPGAPPIKSRYGWINIFHGVRSTMDGNPYVLGVALHDLDNPQHVKVSSIPILFPSAADCRVTPEDYVHVPNVVFTCGAVRRDDGTIYIYYGGNDTVMNLAITHEDILAELIDRYPQDPLTGKPLYEIN